LRRWGLLIAGLYGLLLASLTVPVVAGCFVGEMEVSDLRDAWKLYRHWQYWAVIALMALCQLVMLIVPVRTAMKRPTSRLSVILPIAVSGLMIAILAVGAGAATVEFVYADPFPDNDLLNWSPLFVGPAIWIGWAVFFLVKTRTQDPFDTVMGQTRWLKRASVMTLLVAVPTHIIARHRAYCCAGFSTFLGIATGLAVLLFAFGPGVFLLYFARWKHVWKPGARGKR
jgi:hypothetical protein